MARLTIAQRRELQVQMFTERFTHNEKETRKILTSYYRFLALNDRLNILENDSRTAYTRYTQELQEKFDKWHERLSKWLSPYELKLVRPWSTYYIDRVDDKTGRVDETIIEPIFYR